MWVEVENDFSNLLSKLSSQNEKTESNTSASKTPIESVNRSLEEQSKKSKARVHYQKFTRGKDLSRYSKKDLECIFGVSSKSAESNHEENKNFVQSGNMQEYFSRKNAKNKSETESFPEPTEEIEETKLNETQEDVPKKKKKKGKKRKHKETELCEKSNREIEGQEIKDEITNKKKDLSSKEEVEVKKKKTKNNKEPLEMVESVEDNEEKCELKIKKKKKSEPNTLIQIQQLDGTYDSSEVEEFMVDPTKQLEACCTANIKNKEQINLRPSPKTSKKVSTLKRNSQLLVKVKSVLEASMLIKDETTVHNLNENNEEMSKQVDAIVKAKINNYLSQVFNRKEKISNNPVREMKEKKKKMIQDDDSCLQFNGSNLCSIPGYVCY